MTSINSHRTPPRRRVLPRLGALLIVPIGALLVLGSFIPGDNPESQAADAPLGFAGAVLIAVGGLWLVRARQIERAELEQFHDREVLTVASRHDGRATIAQVSVETALSPDEAEAALMRLCRQNLAQPDVLDDGTVVYTFGLIASQRA